MKNKIYATKIEHLDEADRYSDDLCIKLPDELMKQLGWGIGDEVKWEVCEDCDKYMGLTLSNLSKCKRDAEQAWRNAVSVDME